MYACHFCVAVITSLFSWLIYLIVILSSLIAARRAREGLNAGNRRDEFTPVKDFFQTTVEGAGDISRTATATKVFDGHGDP
jgi:hypothetical protein